jgi:hypothetical protein
MTDHDQTVMYPANGDRGPARLFPFGEFPVSEEQPSDVATGLVSLGFIGAAIRRSVRFVCVMAIIGLVIGVGYLKEDPPAYKASTSVLLTYGPTESPASAIFDNQTIAESHTVALLAMGKLGLPQQSLGSFAAAYTVAVVTDRVLTITASAPTSAAAVSHASALATAFLQFRAKQEETAQSVLISSLEQELVQARQSVQTYASQISQLQAQTSTPAQQAQLKNVQAEHDQAITSLNVLEQTIAGDQTDSGTLAAVAGSVVLDPAAPLAHSKLKSMVTYAAYGLLGGLAVGLGIVIVRAITSDRLRRRDDIARALGAPVKLSVGPVRLSRRLPPSRRGLEARDNVHVRRIVAYLHDAVSARERRAALAVVPVDDPEVAALAVVSLAMSYAEEGRKVVLADLAVGAPAATLLGGKEPGVRMVTMEKARLMLAVPPADDLVPAGPLRGSPDDRRSDFSEEVANSYSAADLLFTLVTLDPALGADHLQTWAPKVVALVTAGRSSWTKLQAAGELIRLGGSSLTSTVLVGADKSDETLGVVRDVDTLLGVGGHG